MFLKEENKNLYIVSCNVLEVGSPISKLFMKKDAHGVAIRAYH